MRLNLAIDKNLYNFGRFGQLEYEYLLEALSNLIDIVFRTVQRKRCELYQVVSSSKAVSKVRRE